MGFDYWDYETSEAHEITVNFLILQAGMGQRKHLSTKALQSQPLGFTELLHLLDRKNLMFLPWC